MSDKTLAEMLARNSKFAENYHVPPPLKFNPGTVPPQSPGVLLISCSDPRLNPYQIFGATPGFPVVMIRNAGGRAFDALRTIAMLSTIGNAGMVVVMHHTDCGTTHISDTNVADGLIPLFPEHEKAIRETKFGEITGPIEESIRADVALLRASYLVRPETKVVGLKYDIDTGRVTEIDRA